MTRHNAPNRPIHVSPGPRSGRRRRAFSLIELLVVLAIVALVAGLGAPALLRFTGRRRLHAAAREVVSLLQGARRLAISQRRRVAVVISVTERTVLVVDAGTEEALQKAYRLAEPVEWARLGSPESDPVVFADDTIVFLPTGALQSGSGSLWMSLPGKEGVEIAIAKATGQPRILAQTP